MQLNRYVDGNDLMKSVHQEFIRVARHNELPLCLYTYTQKAVFDGTWSDATRKSRGMVVEDTGEIVGRCMPKFFNYSEHVNGKEYAGQLPVAQDFKIFAKMDGSMGTAFFYDDDWHVASKGSFHSEQAEWATKFLRKKLADGENEYMSKLNGFAMHATSFDPLDRQKTYVCEIIYPTNRIVVDYGALEDLVLLTVFDNETGEECMNEERKLEWGWVGSVVPEFDPHGIDVAELQLLADENVLVAEDEDRTVGGTAAEGYVVRFEGGQRCKIKLSDYLRLHKILTQCNERTIWEAVSQGTSLHDFVENVPDEFHDWVLSVHKRLIADHASLLSEWEEEFYAVKFRAGEGCSRKEFALEALGSPHGAALFLHYDENDEKLNELAWKKLRPAAEKPFRKDADV